MAPFLHNQDRDRTYYYRDQDLTIAPALSPSGELWGFNLYLDKEEDSLGTFDTLTEIFLEIFAIKHTTCPEWFVSGYSGDDDIWNDICEMMRDGE